MAAERGSRCSGNRNDSTHYQPRGVLEVEEESHADADSDADYEPEMEELPVSIEVEADLEDTFFDQDAR